jgi:hypothetical protein
MLATLLAATCTVLTSAGLSKNGVEDQVALYAVVHHGKTAAQDRNWYPPITRAIRLATYSLRNGVSSNDFSAEGHRSRL